MKTSLDPRMVVAVMDYDQVVTCRRGRHLRQVRRPYRPVERRKRKGTGCLDSESNLFTNRFEWAIKVLFLIWLYIQRRIELSRAISDESFIH